MTTTERTEFDAAAAEGILRKACALADVEPDGIEMLRFGDHAVFRIAGGRIVSRVGRSPDRLSSVRREVAVAGWLAAEEYPAARLVTDAEQPIVIDGHPVTFWEGLADGDTYATTREMGELLRRLHELEPPPISLPPLDPFDKVATRLERSEISAGTRTYLRSLAEELAAEYDHLRFTLPAGPLHGDFNVGNVLHDAAGHPKVIDLDGFVVGPREWDLMQTACITTASAGTRKASTPTS
ncbi:UNVERIFIED_CONTAM: aminoglycoside phosphotransferase [Streptomyces graminofaciens]